MYQGKTLSELAEEVERQAEVKVDYVADTRSLMMNEAATELQIEGLQFRINELAHRQIGSRLQVPAKYYDRLRASHPDLLMWNVNTLFRKEPAARMIRTLDGTARAFLSNRYRRIDNDQILGTSLRALQETGLPLHVGSCEVTDSRLYLKVLFPTIQGEVKTSKQLGDVVRSGVMVSNSEVGQGSFVVTPFLERLVCLNGMVMNSMANRKNHVGAAAEERDGIYELLQDDTREADDKALMLKLRDLIQNAASEVGLQRCITKFEEAAGREITGDPAKAVEVLGNTMRFNERENASVLRNLIQGADLSQWGVANAVTAMAQDDAAVDTYDRATELEAAGGQIIELAEHDWQVIATAA